VTAIGFIVLLIVAGLCGALGTLIAGFSRRGFLASIGVGLIGALLGSWIARVAHLPEPIAITVGGAVFPVIWAVAGSALFVAIVHVGRRYA
jgi:uncharacterized membrane protein YeaQ/YmgE (transglycosylase-associated protein family)